MMGDESLENARRRGRPKGTVRVSEPGMAVSAWLRPSEYDRLVRLANQHDKSVSALVRQLLIVRLP